MSIDPDFIITVNGEEVTKYVEHWKLTDDEKKSSLLVVMKNPDQVLSNKFETGHWVEIVFGYVGNMGEKVKMKIKQLEESYCVEEAHDYISVLGLDALDDLEKGNVRSGGSK